VNVRLLRHQEARTHPRRIGPEHEDRGEAASIGHPSGRYHGYRPDRVDNGGHERQRGHLPPYPAPGLPALGHDHVDARLHGTTGLLGGTDRVKVQGAAVVDAVDVRARVAPERGHRRHRLPGARLDPLVLRPLQDEVDSERTVRQRPSGTDAFAHSPRRCPGQREHAKAPGIRNGGGQLGRRRAAHRRLHHRRRKPEPAAERRHLEARARRHRGTLVSHPTCDHTALRLPGNLVAGVRFWSTTRGQSRNRSLRSAAAAPGSSGPVRVPAPGQLRADPGGGRVSLGHPRLGLPKAA
jgi:hypothetical protein